MERKESSKSELTNALKRLRNGEVVCNVEFWRTMRKRVHAYEVLVFPEGGTDESESLSFKTYKGAENSARNISLQLWNEGKENSRVEIYDSETPKEYYSDNSSNSQEWRAGRLERDGEIIL